MTNKKVVTNQCRTHIFSFLYFRISSAHKSESQLQNELRNENRYHRKEKGDTRKIEKQKGE